MVLENGYIEDADHRRYCSIDRIDPNKDYCPENCRWADAKTQMANRRCTKRYNYQGKLLSVPEISRMTGIRQDAIHRQLYKGISIEEAIETLKQYYGIV